MLKFPPLFSCPLSSTNMSASYLYTILLGILFHLLLLTTITFANYIFTISHFYIGYSLGSPERQQSDTGSVNQGVLITHHSGEHGNPSDPQPQGDSLMGRAVTLPTPALTKDETCIEQVTETPCKYLSKLTLSSSEDSISRPTNQ